MTISSCPISGIERNFDVNPHDNEVYLSDTAAFQCDIKSIPRANITWFKDDSIVTDRTNKFRTYQEGVLEISNVEFSDLGTYHCLAEGVDKTRRSDNARLSQKRAGGQSLRNIRKAKHFAIDIFLLF